MTVLTSDDFLNQMITQVRLLDPSFSGEPGTPEWKMLSSVAQSLASNQVDMTGLANSLNISSKVGSNIDNFTSDFGITRQTATPSQGYVIFTRPTPAPANIVIPQGTAVQANAINFNSPTTVQFTTSVAGSIPQGDTTSGQVTVQSVSTGSAMNVPAGAITQFVGTIPSGVSAVTNPVAITNGSDAEDDNVFISRFQNTWARNLSGTSSSYLAVALAGAFSTKAVCIGQQSVYTEYIQVPYADDSNTVAASKGMGLWTSALSDIPYAKQIFGNVPTFISDNGAGTYYYQQGVDYLFNTIPLLQGDALREISTTAVGNATTLVDSPPFSMEVESSNGFSDAGTLTLKASDNNWYTVIYTSIGINESTDTPFFGGCQIIGSIPGSTTTVAGNPIYQIPDNVSARPNFTFTNVSSVIDSSTGQYTTQFDATTGEYVTNSATVDPTDTLVTVQALTPGQVVQSEFRYVSSASRNDMDRGISNCVDVYVNGSNPQQVSCVILPPSNSANSLSAQFNNSYSSPYYAENFRRDGNPQRRPNVLNYWTPLFNPPIVSIPSVITGPDGSTFFLGVHYWLVHEVSNLANSIASRDGIEWSYQMWGDSQSSPPADNAGYLPGGPTSSTIMNYGEQRLPVTITNYSNDANIINMQATYQTQSPATVDVLAHMTKTRYFKFDVTLMYSSNASSAIVQSSIATSLQNYLDNQYFGTVIQLSSILDQIAGVGGVQNVRWSNDLPTPPNQIRAIETDINGNPLCGVSTSRHSPYSPTTAASFLLTVTGSNFGADDSFVLSWNDTVLGHTFGSPSVSYEGISTTTLTNAINTALSGEPGPYSGGVTVTEYYNSNSTTDPYVQYLVTYGASYSAGMEQPVVPTVLNNITRGSYLYNEDFFLMDDELPSLPTGQVSGDSLPGLMVRTRAENTFYRPGT